MARDFVSKCRLPIADGVGTVGVTVKDDDGVTVTARSTAGVVLGFDGDGYGIYQKKLSIPDDVLMGVAYWDDGDGNATAESFTVIVDSSGLPAEFLRPDMIFTAAL